MARIARDARIETREARKRLRARHEPYWRQIHRGLSVGYRKGPQGGVWVMRRMVDGKYLKSRLGTADDRADGDGRSILSYRDASHLAMDREPEPVESGYTVTDAVMDYLEARKGHIKTYRDTKQTCKTHIIAKLGKKKVASLTSTEIRRWLGKLAETDSTDPEATRRRKSTANRVFTILKAVLNHAFIEGKVSSQLAWKRVKPFADVDEANLRFLTEAEAKRLINVCQPDFRQLVQAALFTGCRYGEIIRLRCRDYSPDSGTLTISHSKTAKARHVPLTDEGSDFFEVVTAGRPRDAVMFLRDDDGQWGESHQSRPMRAACERAKISPPISFHGLRRSYGSFLALKGVPLQIIATALGHSSTRMTEKHYAHLQPSHITDTIRANLPSFGTKKSKVRKLS